MKSYKYLIIGGGLAGDAATQGIREVDTHGTIGMLSMEPGPPYMRPNLSKGLWKGRPVEKIWRNTQGLGAELHLGRMVTLGGQRGGEQQSRVTRRPRGIAAAPTRLFARPCQ